MGGCRLIVGAALCAVALTACAVTEEPPVEAGAEASSATDPQQPPGSTAPGSTATGPTTGSTPPTPRIESGGARAQVPADVILQQLRRAAERIAQNYTAPPAPTPVDVDPGTNRALGYQLMLAFGFAPEQWQYLDALWQRESGWNQLADNPTSTAYGIPQSLPGSKMAVVGDDWRTNPETQIRWGLAYIAARYGRPEGAWAHSQRLGWY